MPGSPVRYPPGPLRTVRADWPGTRLKYNYWYTLPTVPLALMAAALVATARRDRPASEQ